MFCGALRWLCCSKRLNFPCCWGDLSPPKQVTDSQNQIQKTFYLVFCLGGFALKGESKRENLRHLTCVKFSLSKERDLFRLALQCLLGNPGMCGMGAGGASAVI